MAASSDRSRASAPGTATGLFAIDAHGLTKHFGKHTAVDDLTVRVPAGAIAGFVGPNGAGKTTTIRILLGLVRPNAGSATILGHSIAEPERYLPRVGALTEAPAFYPGLSGRTNLEVLARLSGYPRSRVSELLEVVDLSDRSGDRVGTYSLGMKQRLGMAMALLPDPELLILDEPGNGLDPLGIIAIRDLLRRLVAQGKTILLSSHLLGELEQVTDWLIMLNRGKALFCGPARDLLAQRVEVQVEGEDAVQLGLVARIVTEAGYAVSREDRALRFACPTSFADTLNRQAQEAGAPDLIIRVRAASLEQLFLDLLKGDRS